MAVIIDAAESLSCTLTTPFNPQSGGTPFAIFCWVMGVWNSATTGRIIGFGDLATTMKSGMRTGWNDPNSAIASIESGQPEASKDMTGNQSWIWTPCMKTWDGSGNWDMYVGISTDEQLHNGATVSVDDGQSTFMVNEGSTGRGFWFTHVCYWDRYFSTTDWNLLNTESGGKCANPTTVYSSDILSYWPFDTVDQLTAVYGSDKKTLTDSGSVQWDVIATGTPDVDPYTTTSVPRLAANLFRQQQG